MKNVTAEVETYWIGSAAEWWGQRKDSVNWKIEPLMLPSLTNRESRLKKKKKACRTSGTYRTVAKDLTFFHNQSPRRRGKEDWNNTQKE